MYQTHGTNADYMKSFPGDTFPFPLPSLVRLFTLSQWRKVFFCFAFVSRDCFRFFYCILFCFRKHWVPRGRTSFLLSSASRQSAPSVAQFLYSLHSDAQEETSGASRASRRKHSLVWSAPCVLFQRFTDGRERGGVAVGQPGTVYCFVFYSCYIQRPAPKVNSGGGG